MAADMHSYEGRLTTSCIHESTQQMNWAHTNYLCLTIAKAEIGARA